MGEIVRHRIDGEWTESGHLARPAGVPRQSRPVEQRRRSPGAVRHRARGPREPVESSSDGYPGPLAQPAPPGREEPQVKWLTPAELDSWLSVVRLLVWLPWSIDQQL